MFIDVNIAIYYDSFGIEYTPQEILTKIRHETFTHKIFRIQLHDSMIGGYFCIVFIEYMLQGKSSLNFTDLFSINDYKTLIE